MTFSDIIEEYKFVNSTLANCNEYFDTAEELIATYFTEVSEVTSNFFFRKYLG